MNDVFVPVVRARQISTTAEFGQQQEDEAASLQSWINEAGGDAYVSTPWFKGGYYEIKDFYQTYEFVGTARVAGSGEWIVITPKKMKIVSDAEFRKWYR